MFDVTEYSTASKTRKVENARGLKTEALGTKNKPLGKLLIQKEFGFKF